MFFFFKQKTAYEMRISDWSSDVCSSDLAKFGQFIHENAVSQGLQWPSITPEQMYAAGVDWHLFPNQVMLMGPTGLLGYRARPLGTNPDKCIWDVYSLQRYPAGEAPKVEQEWSQDHGDVDRSEEHTSELQSLMRKSAADF